MDILCTVPNGSDFLMRGIHSWFRQRFTPFTDMGFHFAYLCQLHDLLDINRHYPCFMHIRRKTAPRSLCHGVPISLTAEKYLSPAAYAKPVQQG